MKKKYLVFTVQAFQIQTPDGMLLENCTLELIAANADEALERAKKIVEKPFYRLTRVFENFYDQS